MNLPTLALIVFSLVYSSVALTDTLGSAKRTKNYSIKSKVLGEKRQIYVRTPPAYDAKRSYPVVYVLDGEWNFEYVASYLDYLADNDVYPQMIVTGVTNKDRNRDYVPAADLFHPHTGYADEFRQFVADEWIPLLGKKYPVSDDRVLVGHSFGGVFTLHALFSQPELFNAYIALGTSAWVGDDILFQQANAYFDQPDAARRFVYMAVGEGDGGPTVPSSKRMAALFEQRAPQSLEWEFSVTPETDHFKNLPSGLHDAFMALFPAWGFVEQMTKAATDVGAAGVNSWFAEKESTLGFRFRPAWFDLGIAGARLARDADHVDAALVAMENLRRHHPDNPFVLSFSASVYKAAGDIEAGITAMQRAMTVVRRDKLHPNAIQIEILERQLANLQQASEE